MHCLLFSTSSLLVITPLIYGLSKLYREVLLHTFPAFHLAIWTIQFCIYWFASMSSSLSPSYRSRPIAVISASVKGSFSPTGHVTAEIVQFSSSTLPRRAPMKDIVERPWLVLPMNIRLGQLRWMVQKKKELQLLWNRKRLKLKNDRQIISKPMINKSHVNRLNKYQTYLDVLHDSGLSRLRFSFICQLDMHIKAFVWTPVQNR